MDCLLIKQALYKGKHYTPEEWSNHPEQLSKSRKKDEIKLECPDGCELGFRCGHMRKGVSVQPHFFHKCQDRKASCLYMKKYRHHKGGGESIEHMLAKNMIADMDVSFERTCIHPSCHNSAIIKPETLWTSDTEVRVNDKWLADVVYYGLDEEIKCVIEVKHKHAVDGAKRKWLLNQPFDYMEVSTNEDVSKTRYQIIDMKGDYYCMDSEMLQCHTERKQLDAYFVKWCLRQDLTKGSWYLYQRWGSKDCEDYDCTCNIDDLHRYGYDFLLLDKDCSLREKFNSFPQLVQAEKDQEEEKRQAEKEAERWREMEKLRLKKEQEEIALSKTLTDTEWRAKWRNSEINKYLSELRFKSRHGTSRYLSDSDARVPSGKFKGIHILLVAYIYPHQINWILGYMRHPTRTWREYIEKYDALYEFCHYLTRGYKLKYVPTYRIPYTSTIYGTTAPFNGNIYHKLIEKLREGSTEIYKDNVYHWDEMIKRLIAEEEERHKERESLRLKRKREQEAEETRLRLKRKREQEAEETRLRLEKENAKAKYLHQKWIYEDKMRQKAVEARLKLAKEEEERRKKEREERRKKQMIREQNFEKDWINSPINKYLLEKEPKYEYNCSWKSCKWNGVHLLLIAYADPEKLVSIQMNEKGHKDDIYRFIKVVRNNTTYILPDFWDKIFYDEYNHKQMTFEYQESKIEKLVMARWQQYRRWY